MASAANNGSLFQGFHSDSVAMSCRQWPGSQQDVRWASVGISADFNQAGSVAGFDCLGGDANWSPAVVPTGTAFFGTSSTTAVSFSADASFGGWTFNSGASTYHFTNSRSLSFIDAGINA